jgi:hypothetical protein
MLFQNVTMSTAEKRFQYQYTLLFALIPCNLHNVCNSVRFILSNDDDVNVMATVFTGDLIACTVVHNIQSARILLIEAEYDMTAYLYRF